jgi:sugar phosphate isomerase/epimerase
MGYYRLTTFLSVHTIKSNNDIPEEKMRFGIIAMQMQALLPRGNSPQEMMSNLAGFDHASLVWGIADQGFNLIELGGDLTLFFPQAYSPTAIEKLSQLKKEKGLSYTVHLPLWSVEPSTLLQPVRAGSAQALVDCIRATMPLEPESYVLHATGALAAEFYQMRIPEMGKALILRQFQANAGETIKQLVGETGIPNRKLAIETVEFPFELTLEIAEKLDVSICLDTGHVMVGFSGPVQLFDVLESVLPRLGEIHLHDGPWQGLERKIGYGKDHASLGTGDVDVARFLKRLDQAAYQGPIIFELTLPEAKQSLEYIRQVYPSALS